MPFIAECPYCKVGKIRAPDNAVGWSGECPNPECGSSFTLVPMAKAPVHLLGTGKSVPSKAQASDNAGGGTVVIDGDKPTATSGDATLAVKPEPVPEGEASPVRLSPRPVAAPPAALPRRVNLVAVLSLLCASASLAAFSIAPLVYPSADVITLPLAGLGLVLGIIGLILALGTERGVGFAFVGPALAIIVGVVTTLWPTLIDPTRGVPSAEELDLNRRTVVPLGSQMGEARSAAPDEWIDAKQGAVEIGDLWLRVTGVTIEHPELRTQGKKAFPPESYLVIRIQIANVGASRRIDYESWADSGKVRTKHRPLLQDPTGRRYSQHQFPLEVEVVGQVDKGFLYPGKYLDDTLVFDPPAGRVEYLRLELPASAFGGEGTVRLRLPGSMISHR